MKKLRLYSQVRYNKGSEYNKGVQKKKKMVQFGKLTQRSALIQPRLFTSLDHQITKRKEKRSELNWHQKLVLPVDEQVCMHVRVCVRSNKKI